MSTDSAPAPEGEPPVQDDVWEQFLQDTERDIRTGAPKEPSARARIVTRRLREADERVAAGARRRWSRRNRASASAASASTAWRTGTTDAQERRTRRRSRLRGLIGVVVAVAVVFVALSPSRSWSFVTGDGGRHGSAAPIPTGFAPEAALPTAAAPSSASALPTLQRPFAGSPADTWEEGPDAIHLPEPAAYGASSAPQVAAALRLAKEFVVGANLDPTVIAGGYPATALAVVDPFSAVGMKAVTAGLAHPTRQGDPINLFSRFGPEARLATEVVKVRGETTLSKGSLGGVRIDLDYSFAYALREASDHGSSPGITRTVVRRALSFQLADPARFPQTPGTVDLTHTASELDNSSCAADDGFLHPQFADGSAAAGIPTAAPGGPTVDPYDRSKPVGAGRSDGDCAKLTRT